MDVDPLRPKTVPLSAETVLWFEFLLTPELLTKHLSKENADPSAIELMKQFLSITPEYPPDPIPLDDEPQEIKIDLLKYGRKHLALKILTLKIASHLNWNLEIIEQNLTIRKQVQILSDLCSITTAKINKSTFSYEESSSDTPENPKHAVNFARTLYNRWVLRVQVNKEFPYINKTCFGQVLPKEESALLMRFIASLEPHTTKSIKFLKKICEAPEPFKILTYDSFNALLPNSDRINQNFNITKTISKAELRTQVYYDMSTYYLYSKNYDLSREYLTLCAENLKILKSEYETSNKPEFLFCTVDETILNGYLLANAIIIPETNLVHQMCTSSLNKYAGIIDILKKDNLLKEIPLVQRKTLELHIEAEISSGIISNNYESASLYVPALNTIRIIIDDNHNNIITNTNYFIKNKYNQKAYDILIEVTKHFLKNSDNLTEKLKIKDYFLNILLSDLCTLNLEKSIQSLKLFNENELIELKRYDNEFIDDYLTTLDNNVEFTDFKNQKLQRRQYEKELISCTTANKVRKMLVKIVTPKSSFNKLLYQVNPSWSIPTAIKPVVKGLPRGFLQDFSYILLGKAREMATKKDFNNALSILYQLKLETQRPDLSTTLIVTKLNKLISWEILLVQICQYLDEWPIKKFNDKLTLIKKCKECVMLLTTNQQNQTTTSGTNELQVIPRNEIIGYCFIMLLNLNEYDVIINIDDKSTNKTLQYDLVSVFAQAANDIENYKINKHNRDAWDLVITMFLQNNNNNGNSNSNNGGNSSNNNNKRNNNLQQNRDSPIFLTSTNLNPFLDKLREPLIISLILSLLARLFNILKDETNLELSAEYIFLWPTSISNANGYSITLVSETLYYLLNIGLKYHPQNIAWLKLKGDLDLLNNNFDSAMKNYINSIMTGTEYCTLIIQRPLIDDCLVRKMIKCCSNLGCHMQATVLCQFLDDIDYGIAFKNISENKLNTSDAMDGYYSYIWDTTLLEFIINMHGKRGEHTRKLQTISHMGLLELNANNNDDVKREAATIRKTKFLRVLAKQYML